MRPQIEASTRCLASPKLSAWSFLPIVVGLVGPWVTAGVAETKLIVLKNGTTLEAEIHDESENSMTVMLRSGTLVTLAKEEIEGVEDFTLPESVEAPPEEIAEEIDFGTIGQGVPTPTPLPIVPIDLRLESFTLRRHLGRLPSTSSLTSPLFHSIPENAEADSQEKPSAVGQTFGHVVWVDGLGVYRRGDTTWEPILRGFTLEVGDEINSLKERLEILVSDGSALRLDRATQANLLEQGVSILEGKAWLDGRNRTSRGTPFSFRLRGIQAAAGSGVVLVETLRSGLKVAALEGSIDLSLHPEGNSLLKEGQGPNIWLLGLDRKILSESKDLDFVERDWKDWERRAEEAGDLVPDYIAAGSGTDETPEGMRLRQIERLELLAASIQDFYRDSGRFPEEKQPFFSDLIRSPGTPNWSGPYLKEVSLPLVDVWGSEILYRTRTNPVSADLNAEICSIGPDKKFQEGKGDDLLVVIARPSR